MKNIFRIAKSLIQKLLIEHTKGLFEVPKLEDKYELRTISFIFYQFFHEISFLIFSEFRKTIFLAE